MRPAAALEELYCIYRNVEEGLMIGCDNKDCPYEWFHVGCVGLDCIPQGEWYCADCVNQILSSYTSQMQKQLQCMQVQYNKLCYAK